MNSPRMTMLNSSRIWGGVACVILALLLCPAQEGFCAILFSENFNSHSNWSPDQSGTTECWDPCNSAPVGYEGYRVMGTIFPDGNPRHNTLNIDSTNPRGGTGKSLTYWVESGGGTTIWPSDGLLVKDLGQEYNELYARVWIKFQPGWQFVTTENPMQKFFRIAHYMGAGMPWGYSANGLNGQSNTMPQMIFDLAKYGGGTSDLAAVVSPRCSPGYYCSPNTTGNFYFPAMNGKPAGSYGGGGIDFGDPGMVGDGNWHCWEFYMKTNSAVGRADGIYKFWQDGVLIGQANNIAWSDTGTPRIYGWNQVILGGNNMNPYANVSAGAEQWYAFDDFVIYTPMSPSDPACNGQCTTDGRLPLNYVIGGGQPPDTTAPRAPSGIRIR